MVGGGVPMAELVHQIQLEMPVSQETLATWLGNRMGRMPRPGDVYKVGKVEFLVRRVKRGKAFEVAVTAK
jgi:CBS domain containing-hemolysin-like protein